MRLLRRRTRVDDDGAPGALGAPDPAGGPASAAGTTPVDAASGDLEAVRPGAGAAASRHDLPSTAAVALRGVSHRYRTRAGDVLALDSIDLDVAPGERVALVGPSGSGKSTLLSVIGGLEPIQEGDAVVAGRDLHALVGDELAAYRRRTVGFVFQHFGLLEGLTAAENVELAGTLSGARPADRAARAQALLASVGLLHRADHRPLQLSGGERQRVAIARALAAEPALLLADEPTGNLDDASADAVVTLLEELQRARGFTLVVVTHSAAVAERMERTVALSAGRIVA